jgi:hypothetical protein
MLKGEELMRIAASQFLPARSPADPGYLELKFPTCIPISAVNSLT